MGRDNVVRWGKYQRITVRKVVFLSGTAGIRMKF